MDTTAVIGVLGGVIASMAGFFVFIMKDERARNDRLLSRIDEQHKLVLNAVDVLGKAVDTVHGKQQLYDVIGKLNATMEHIKSSEHTQRQLYEAIEQLHEAVEVLEQVTAQRRPNSRQGGAGANETNR